VPARQKSRDCARSAQDSRPDRIADDDGDTERDAKHLQKTAAALRGYGRLFDDGGYGHAMALVG
jgi:hypothetical protein